MTKLTAEDGRLGRAWIAVGCIVAAVILLGCLPVLAGRAVPVWDACDYFAPLFSLVADHAKSGRLLLWNPWINGGSPDFAEPQVGSTSPVLLLFAIISPNPFAGFIAYWLAVWIFGGVGMMLLCRHLKAPLWGALIVSLGFIASGVYTSNAQHTSWIYSFSFLPWIVWRFDEALLQGSYWGMLQTGVLWGLSAQGGYPGATILDPFFLALWGVGRLWVSREKSSTGNHGGSKRSLLYFVFALLILGFIGLAVMSPAYVSFLQETRGYTFRAGPLDRQFSLSSGVLPPAAFATLASPFLYLLNFPPQLIWPETDISMSNIYMGILVTILALVALCQPSRWRVWLALIAVFFGCCAVGSHLPVRGWIYDLVPPTRYFRMPALFRAYVILIAGVLAAYATRDLDKTWEAASPPRIHWWLLIVSAATAVAAVLAYSATMHTAHRSLGSAPYPFFHLLIAWLSALLIFFLGWRGKLSRKVWLYGLVLLAVFDAGSTLYISTPTIYSLKGKPHWQAMDAQHTSNLSLLSKGWSRQFLPSEDLGADQNDRNVAPKDAGFCNRTPLKNRFFQHYLDDPALSRIALGKQRIWFSDRPAWLSPTDANFSDFSQVSHSLGFPVMVLHTSEEMKAASNPSAAVDRSWIQSARSMSPATVSLIAYLPNALSFSYQADRDGWLLVTDRWANAWTVRINGHPQQVLGGDFIFRAVPVSRGENIVEFRYKPRGYVAWVVLSWSVLALVAILQVWMLATRRFASGGAGKP